MNNSMKALKNILDGMALMGEVLASPAPYPDIRHGFSKDREALRRDARQVTREFNRQIHSAYGQQKHAS